MGRYLLQIMGVLSSMGPFIAPDKSYSPPMLLW